MHHLNIQNTPVPALGFGTYRLEGDEGVAAVIDAIELGYRHIDTAKVYENEDAVGRAIRECGVDRGEIFLTTKITPGDAAPDDYIPAAEGALKRLGLDYIDLLLLHWPNRDVPIADTMAAACSVRERGLTRHVGVSNFTPTLLREAVRHAPIFCNQVEYHPFLSQDKLVALAAEMGIMLTAYCPLARNKGAESPVINAVADAHGKTPAQVVLRWLIQHPNVAAIPKAGSHKHRAGNLDIFDFELTDDEMTRIAALDENYRICDPDGIAPDWER